MNVPTLGLRSTMSHDIPGQDHLRGHHPGDDCRGTGLVFFFSGLGLGFCRFGVSPFLSVIHASTITSKSEVQKSLGSPLVPLCPFFFVGSLMKTEE